MKREKPLEEKIAAAEDKVAKLHKPYTQAIEELRILLDQKDDYKKGSALGNIST